MPTARQSRFNYPMSAGVSPLVEECSVSPSAEESTDTMNSNGEPGQVTPAQPHNAAQLQTTCIRCPHCLQSVPEVAEMIVHFQLQSKAAQQACQETIVWASQQQRENNAIIEQRCKATSNNFATLSYHFTLASIASIGLSLLLVLGAIAMVMRIASTALAGFGLDLEEFALVSVEDFTVHQYSIFEYGISTSYSCHTDGAHTYIASLLNGHGPSLMQAFESAIALRISQVKINSTGISNVSDSAQAQCR
ncbi:hypothetical protein HD806DRAFT_518099 [Xylariaceae sp. AK1471]|nr:hypothetical protein HD806DRAFT_518099 [Xylariaceae sp. AK1471]